MSTKKKLLIALIVFIVAVGSRALSFLLDYEDTYILPILISAVMFAVFYDKLVFCGRRFISALVHSAIWFGIDMTYFALIYALDDSEEKKHGMIRLDDTLLIGLCFWAGFFVLSLIIIGIKKRINKSNEKTENDQMIKEIMEKNQESNFKEKNDV